MAETKKFSPMRLTAATEEAAVNGVLEIVNATRDQIDYDVLERTERGVTVRVRPRSLDLPAPPAPAPEVEARTELGGEVESSDVADDGYGDHDDPGDRHDSGDHGDHGDHDDSGDRHDSGDSVAHGETWSERAERFEPVAVSQAESDSADDETGYGPDPVSYDDSEPAPRVVLGTGTTAQAATQSLPNSEPGPDPEPINEEAAAGAVALAQDFLDRMGLEARALLGEGGNADLVPILVEGPDVGILIGKHGQTLQAFQYLLNVTLSNHRGGEHGLRVVVDAGNYRARRQSSLEQSARAAAAKVRREKRPVRMEPMPAHERRLVHMFLQNETEITTLSEGREPSRRIVINPAGSGGTPRDSDRPARTYGGNPQPTEASGAGFNGGNLDSGNSSSGSSSSGSSNSGSSNRSGGDSAAGPERRGFGGYGGLRSAPGGGNGGGRGRGR